MDFINGSHHSQRNSVMQLLVGSGIKSAEVMLQNLLNDLHFFPYVSKCSGADGCSQLYTEL